MKDFVKDLVPLDLRRAMRGWRTALSIFILYFFSKSFFLSRLYYFLFSREFDREFRSVLVGRLVHLTFQGKGVYALRRNIHRLEKGLLMQPRKKVFGEHFIEDTVEYLRIASVKQFSCMDEMKWATDVLDLYFSVVGSTEKIARAQRLYDGFRGDLKSDIDGSYSPYEFKCIQKPDIPKDQLDTLFKARRSVRWYEDRAIPKDLVIESAEIAAQAPSACNRLPYRFVFVEEKAHIATIAPLANGTAGFAQNIPFLVVVVGDLSAYEEEKDRHLIYIDSSLASMQFMLALEVRGLSSCPINWPDMSMSEHKIKETLKLGYHEKVIMFISVGYAVSTGGIAYSQKKKRGTIIEEFSG